jgi:hypothetical protein
MLVSAIKQIEKAGGWLCGGLWAGPHPSFFGAA